MKIGIITFHWATNYGAILQSYALQEYLKKMGHDVHIINYRPKQYNKTLIKCILSPRFWLTPLKLKDYFKEQKLEEFRKEYLNETRLYESLDDLKSNPPNMNVYICGSDQIWNPSFTTLGEGKKTTSYYLDFGSIHIKRIAYAVSFGCEDLPIDAAIIAKNYLQNFNAISVRENSGLKIVKNLGYSNPVLLCDPTMLLNSDDYSLLLKAKNNTKNNTVFNYFLRGKDERVHALNKILSNDYALITDRKILSSNSITDWLGNIKYSSVVVTNSFHGMVLSIIFKTPFIVIGAKGAASAMNDRFRTLLQFLDLQERMIDSIDPDKINELMNTEIDWTNVHEKIRILQDNSLSFLEKYISN